MVILFANTLKTPYYEHVMGSSTHQFTNIVAVGERIKQGVAKFLHLLRKKASKGRRKRSIMLKVAT
jgi:hypothetical protein